MWQWAFPGTSSLPRRCAPRIRDGQYPVGSRLLTEVDLVQETGYSRDTVRAAVRLLRESGWVTVTHGLGTFINPAENRTSP
jgi:GntR family transcriptional regulator